MKASKLLLGCSIGFVLLIVFGAVLLGFFQNRTNASLPNRESINECELLENHAVVRLYRSNGSSATTSDSWSVTYQETESEEKTIFSAYSSPPVKDIECGQNEVALVFYSDNQEILSLDFIRNKLVHKPLLFYKSHLKTPEYRDEVSDWKDIMLY